MRLSKDVMQELATRGINARWFPELTFTEYAARVWKEDYKGYYDYYKDTVAISQAAREGRCNVLFNTYEELGARCEEHANQKQKYIYSRDYEATLLYVTYSDKTFIKKINKKSEVITANYVMQLVAKNEKAYECAYGRFAIAMQKLLKDKGLTRNISVYPTTYGIGVWVFYNFNASEHIAQVEEIMRERGIDYANEYSEHRWVYRFKVSKRQENLNKIYR